MLWSFMVFGAACARDTTGVMRQLDTTACRCSKTALITRYHLERHPPQDLTHSCLTVCNPPNVTANCSYPQAVFRSGVQTAQKCDGTLHGMCHGNTITPSDQFDFCTVTSAIFYFIKKKKNQSLRCVVVPGKLNFELQWKEDLE